MATQGVPAEKSELDGNEFSFFLVLLFHGLYVCWYHGFLEGHGKLTMLSGYGTSSNGCPGLYFLQPIFSQASKWD